MALEEMYTLKRVAAITDSSVIGVRGWIRAGKLKSLRVGRELRITPSALEQFIADSTAAAERKNGVAA